MDLARLRQLQDAIVGPRLATVEGVAEVASVGGFLPEIRIEVDFDQIAAHQVKLPQLYAALEAFEFPANAETTGDSERLMARLRATPIEGGNGKVAPLSEMAQVTMGPLPRRGVLEMDGVEMVGGVVMMRYGAHPLEVTARLEQRLEEIEAGLPKGVTLLTVYDRERLIHSALRTVSTTMIEAMVTASICVVVVLLHFRTSLVISLTLPLTVPCVRWGLWRLARISCRWRDS
jgi:Cu(I)/Ag(I) efflux system membrane protein CusA/SilA